MPVEVIVDKRVKIMIGEAKDYCLATFSAIVNGTVERTIARPQGFRLIKKISVGGCTS